MFRLVLVILTLSSLNLLVDGIVISEGNLAEIIERLLDKKLDGKITAFADRQEKIEDKLMNLDNGIAIIKNKQADLEKKIHEINDVVNGVKSDAKNTNPTKEKKLKNIVKNSTDLEDRVSELEHDMSDVKLGLSAIADDVDDLEEANNIHDQSILYLEQEIDQIEDTAIALSDRVDSNQVTLILHGEQLGVLENSIALLQEQVNFLENTDTSIEERLDDIEAADIIIEQRLDEVEMAVNETLPGDLVEQVKQLENITETQQNDINNLEGTVSALDDKINALQNADDSFEQRISQLEDGGGSMNNMSIGFHAKLTDYTDIPSGTPILYDNVMVNVGNRYSPETGIFTADISGLYFFTQYWLSDYDHHQWLNMYKNGVEQCKSHGDGDSDDDNNAPSCSAAMMLHPGDEVYVSSSEGDPVVYSNGAGFAGILIDAYV